MLFTEFDEELYAKTMKEEGREEGENRLNSLYLKLAAEKRTKDLEKAMQDKNFRNSLYKRYGM